MLIQPHNSESPLYEKITLQQFNRRRSDNPGFYKIEPGDLFDVWNKNDLQNEPKTYTWNGSKLERFILIKGIGGTVY